MCKKERYSIIIPVYNAEKTLDRCLGSLLSQNRTDIEVIAVNDGSTDESQSILEGYKKTYHCLRIITQNNGGVSRARNAGLETAVGEYILFVDSDDYVSDKYFSVLDSFGDEDLYVFARQNICTGKTDRLFLDSVDCGAAFTKKLEQLTIGRKLLSPCNKRFKKNIIQKHHICFVDDFQIAEDFDFCMSYLLCCKSVQASSEVLYCWDISEQNSLSRKYRPFLSEKLKIVYLHIEKMFAEHKNVSIDQKSLLAAVDYLYVRNVFACIGEERKNGKTSYFRDREKYRAVCQAFQTVIGEERSYINAAHKMIRMLLKMEMIFLLYLITYWVKK